MPSRERPLSPHLQVYRWQITMLMSILHRATGIVLALGSLGLAWWLHLLASGGESYETFNELARSLPGQILLLAFAVALIYHLLNGIRHLLWDAGWGYQLPKVYASGYTVFVLTLLLTAAICFVALVGASP